MYNRFQKFIIYIKKKTINIDSLKNFFEFFCIKRIKTSVLYTCTKTLVECVGYLCRAIKCITHFYVSHVLG